MSLNGIILIDKHTGVTSFDIIKMLRNITGIKKIGHGGTLDPLATGLLPVFLGHATKISFKIINLEKSYEVSMILGISTDTGDAEGRIIKQREVLTLSQDAIEKYINKYRGIINQRPPMYSAVKHKGKPLYKYARQGIEINVPERIVEVKEVKILSYVSPILRLFIKCSKGFYVRQFVIDLGNDIGCGANVVALRRLTVGDFSVDDAVTIEDIQNNPDIIQNKLIEPKSSDLGGK